MNNTNMVEPTAERKNEFLRNLIDYCAELKERYDKEEWNDFWEGIVGMSDTDMKYYYLDRDSMEC